MLNPPPELDAKFYRSLYPDLASMTDDQLSAHWTRYGTSEGRQGSAASVRAGLLSLIEPSDAALEIGPFTNPSITGPNVKYFDVLDRAALIERARAHAYPHERAVPIDFVSPTGDLSVVTEQFDVIVSSHCIEHQPDFIAHLRDVSRLLRPGGAYLLVIPDKRYCFDHFIPETTVEAVIAARGRKMHRQESVVETRAHTTHNDPWRHWAGDHGRPVHEDDPARIAAAIAEFNSAQGSYIDVHAWQFTPTSFRALLQQLNKAQLTSFVPLSIYQTPYGTFEFCAVLAPQ